MELPIYAAPATGLQSLSPFLGASPRSHFIDLYSNLSIVNGYIYIYKIEFIPIGSMVLLYMVTWIPLIYPLYVGINIPAPWIRHGML